MQGCTGGQISAFTVNTQNTEKPQNDEAQTLTELKTPDKRTKTYSLFY